MRTITAPGVEIKEIDKSQYAPAMAGTRCFVMGFANKGEPYTPMEFTSRSAWVNYYGEPDNEAERYFFNACMEVINQNGILYCARLPYDNEAKDKMVAHKYKIEFNENYKELTGDGGYFHEVYEADNTIKDAYLIDSAELPYMVERDKVDAWRADEEKVGSNTFVIVDKTCAPYKKIMEDDRKGQQRELLGIVPVITTAANALYAQKLISVEKHRVKYYETLGKIDTLLGATGGIFAGDALSDYNKDNLEASSFFGDIGTVTEKLTNTDLVKQLNSVYKNFTVKYENFKEPLETIGLMSDALQTCINDVAEQLKESTTLASDELSDLGKEITGKYKSYDLSVIADWPEVISNLIYCVQNQLKEDSLKLNSPALSSEAETLSDLEITLESKISDV